MKQKLSITDIIDMLYNVLYDYDIEIINAVVDEYHLKVFFRTIDWNHTFVIIFSDDSVEIHHNDNKYLHTVSYFTNRHRINFVITAAKGFITRMSNDAGYSGTVLVPYCYFDGVIRLEKNYNWFVTDIFESATQNEKLDILLSYIGPNDTLNIQLITKDWNILYKIIIDGEYCTIIGNIAGSEFYVSPKFLLHKFPNEIIKASSIIENISSTNGSYKIITLEELCNYIKRDVTIL